MVVELLQVAEEYLLPTLKHLCEKTLVKHHITIDSVLQLLPLAQLYSCADLKVLSPTTHTLNLPPPPQLHFFA